MLKFVDITDCNDDLLIPWLDLYETSFPPEERVLVSSFLQLLKERAKGDYPDSYMQAVLDDDVRMVAAIRFDVVREFGATYFWYMAVDPSVRNRGIGSACFDEVVRRATEAGTRAMVLEVEMPDHSPDQEMSARRIGFYRRHGAAMLTGIEYMQSVGPHQPAIPMHIMILPIEPVTPQEAFDMVHSLFGNAIKQVGELRLE